MRGKAQREPARRKRACATQGLLNQRCDSESRLYPEPKQVFDLATQEGCTAELTYVT